MSFTGRLTVNGAARVFGLEVEFDASGFGDDAATQVPSRRVAYVFRERGDGWEHAEFDALQVQHLFAVKDLEELINEKPALAFESPAGG